MSERAPIPEDLPAALPDTPRRIRLPYVWILPGLVVCAGLFVAIHEKLEQGCRIEISFRTADDLEPHKTKIRYKAVEIGEVSDIRVAPDRKSVIVAAKIYRNGAEYLVEDTRFWVVRPRVVGGNVTGLGTLVSGAYIGADAGRSRIARQGFVGLELAPIVTSGLPGREFVLHAQDIGSLTVGSAVYYRHIPAGQVVAYALDAGGASVTIKVFINAPYDAYVTEQSRFWQASGVDMAVTSDGLKVHAESLASILEGGVAFQPAETANAQARAAESAADSVFNLYSDKERAMRESSVGAMTFVMYFQGSLRGLSVGAPVDLRGITIGEVKRLSVEYDRLAGTLRFPVEVDVFPRRIGAQRFGPGREDDGEARAVDGRALIDSMVAHGIRAEIKSGNLLTGQNYLSVDVKRGAARGRVRWDARPPVFPTAPGSFEELKDSVADIASKLDKVPIEEISGRIASTLAGLERLLASTDQLMHRVEDSIAPEVQATLEEAHAAMKNAKRALDPQAPLQGELATTLLELSRAARSVSALADYLERHPEAIVRGKPKDRE